MSPSCQAMKVYFIGGKNGKSNTTCCNGWDQQDILISSGGVNISCQPDWWKMSVCELLVCISDWLWVADLCWSTKNNLLIFFCCLVRRGASNCGRIIIIIFFFKEEKESRGLMVPCLWMRARLEHVEEHLEGCCCSVTLDQTMCWLSSPILSGKRPHTHDFIKA